MPAFIVEDGSIVPDATSYVTVAEADDFLSLDPNFNTAWTALPPTDKETWLMFSTRFLDRSIKYKSERINPDFGDQPLSWPRNGVYDSDEVFYEDYTVPLPIKESTIMMAAYYVVNTSINPSAPVSSQIDISAIKLEGIGITFDRRSGVIPTSELNRYPQHLAVYLRGLGTVKPLFGGPKGSEFKPICPGGSRGSSRYRER